MAVETVAEALAQPCLATCSVPYWAAYVRGLVDGYGRGHRDAVAEIEAADDAAWDDCSRRVRAVAGSPSHATLTARRGYDRPGPRPGDYPGGPVDWVTGRPLREAS